MVEALVGTWKLESSENFDELLKELNVGFMTISLKTTESKFKIGEEFEEHKADGSKGKSTFTIDGDKLVQKSDNQGKEYFTTREVEGGKLKVTVKAGNVTCIRTYVKA
ncbi:fatty acid-binding protein, heart isoform X2 [Galendromus occidentalis]|uniref:Fatty acid-binding protein, heart isoform X2 n=1 Tax=Galendromus occidentalis TaxID=34638 RepID=A0AAJ7L3F4_9ACAR|nr:fatty acid-binding protein, heart isoform X2 [Galendromus occidentalis]